MNTLNDLLKKGYKTYISENGSDLNLHLENILPNYGGFLSQINNDKNIIFTDLIHIEKITPYIEISDEFSVLDHRFPGCKHNFKCITVFLHCNALNYDNDILFFKNKIKLLHY